MSAFNSLWMGQEKDHPHPKAVNMEKWTVYKKVLVSPANTLSIIFHCITPVKVFMAVVADSDFLLYSYNLLLFNKIQIFIFCYIY